MSLPDFRPGQSSVSAEDMQELADSVRRFNDPLGGTGNNFFSSSIGDIQQQPPPDNWWIQITEGPVSGSGSGTGAKRAAYGWVTVQRQGTDFIVMNDMPSGDSTNFPAYEQNGNLDVPIDAVVRAWVTSDQGLPCMEFEYCCGSANNSSPPGACIQKILVSNCWQGTTLKQIFNITDGCKVIGTSCEDVPNCGSGCGSGSGIPSIDVCLCSGLSPNYQTFKILGVSNGTCNACSVFNGNWCLFCCGEASANPGCSFHQSKSVAGNLTLFTQSSPCCTRDNIISATIKVHSDGSASLIFLAGSILCPFTPGAFAFYYVQPGQWNCNGVNTMTLIQTSGYCTNWPATITVTGAADASSCSGGGGGTAGDCASCAKTSWTLKMNGAAGCALVTNNACTGCPGIDSSSPYTLTETFTGSCIFTSGITGVFLTCGGSGPTTTPAITFTLFDTGTGWELDIEQGGIVKMTYFLSYAAWNCVGGNVMPAAVNYGGGCNWPNCVLVDA